MASDDPSFLNSFDFTDLPVTAALRDHLVATKEETGKFTTGSLAAAILGSVAQLEHRVIDLENRS